MKTRTALVLSVAGVLLTGSAALAVNTRTLGNSSTSFTGTSNEVLLPQNATTPVSPAPAGTDAPAVPAVPSPGDDSSTFPDPAGTGQPASGHESDGASHDSGDDKNRQTEDEFEDESGDDD